MSPSLAPHRDFAAESLLAGGIPVVKTQNLIRCSGCGDPLYATFPMHTLPGGAMHIGCYMLWERTGITVAE